MSSEPFAGFADFSHFEFESLGQRRLVYRKGQGPGVIVMAEVPGLTPRVADYARRVVDAGFTVFMPSLFGLDGRPSSSFWRFAEVAKACISREFRVFAANESSPLIDWVRALGRRIHDELGGPGIGAIGMCITGNFALALAVEPWMLAPILSQPSLPGGPGKAQKEGLHLRPRELQVVRERCEGQGLRVLGLRFSHDPLCTAARFDRLQAELGAAFEGISIDSSPGNPWKHPRMAHSVLTEHLIDEDGQPTRAALERTLSFLREQLAPGAETH